ncbi:hypothetical protein BDW74DRAFT_156585 [Aspergillus multicolor]|uniref:WD repeat protein n=1 Tax=Aspergillus multicolor TaxID=41759 RepID=UPI003CCCB985
MIEMERGRDSLPKNPGTPLRLGSDDPAARSEAEDLLSRFIKGPFQEVQDTSQRSDNIPSPLLHSAVPKVRAKIPRGNVQLRPQPAIALPVARKKASIPLQESSSGTSSPASDTPRLAIKRRSGRPRVEPVNYYQKFSLHDTESEEKKHPLETSSNGLSRAQPIATRASVLPATSDKAIQRLNPVKSLLSRELGTYYTSQLYAKFTGDFKVCKTWKGASNDVVSLAWSPDGTKFAAGATAQCDEHMMAYNRKNNLMFGNLVTNELHELPDHSIKRPNISVLNDACLYMSVTAVQWFKDTLYTASYDNTVKLWDTSRGRPGCYKTLEHDSKVVVMARSNFTENLLAIGTQTIGYWNVDQAQYAALELPRTRSRKAGDVELVPTSIAWGSTHATKDYLLAGMSEREDGVAQHGLLAAYRVRESTIIPEYFSPSSQNVFDITWHPVLPMFAIACTAGQQASRGTQSTVNLYEPLSRKTRVMELECPALDMNEVVFCPRNTNYISASCTDGITYVWDRRNPDEILHRLRHGDPLNQLDEEIGRELADTGVNMQVWGTALDQFYTGASDGMVKKWNILRAPEDVLVEDVACLKEGIMSGAISPDQTNLLIGDVSGGVHLLSNSPFMSDQSATFAFRECPSTTEESDPDSGVKAARELMATGQIERHPVYGPGKGPFYQGPFAIWARPAGTQSEQIAVTGLETRYEIRQLGGLAPEHRKGLTATAREEIERHILLAQIRNKKRGRNKRRNPGIMVKTHANFIDLCNEPDEEHNPARKAPSKRKHMRPGMGIPIISKIEPSVIDLTGDSDTESNSMAHMLEEEASSSDDDFWWPDSGTIDPNFAE